MAQSADKLKQRKVILRDQHVNLSHGSGGKAMRDLIEDVFLAAFDNEQLAQLEDQARCEMNALSALGDRLAVTTDSYVIDPIFFPGGDIGKLAVCGTVNDLAVGGAIPLFLTCGMIIEEGFPVSDLRTICESMKETAKVAGVKIITGDTKVVNRGAADKLFINTAGIGVIPAPYNIAAHRATPGDVVLINGLIGDHGAAILSARGDLKLENNILSDCQPLHSLIADLLSACPEVHCLRDATRGGVVSVLNEFAQSSGTSIRLDEKAIPIRGEVRGTCEILGLDPLYLANEGKVVVVVSEQHADVALAAMRKNPAGKDSAIIGKVVASPAETVILRTTFGGERVLDMLVGDQLPRIC